MVQLTNPTKLLNNHVQPLNLILRNRFPKSDFIPPSDSGSDDSINKINQLHEIDETDPHPKILEAILGEYPQIKNVNRTSLRLDLDITKDVHNYMHIYHNKTINKKQRKKIPNPIKTISADIFSRKKYLSKSKLFSQLAKQKTITIGNLINTLEKIFRTGELEDLIT